MKNSFESLVECIRKGDLQKLKAALVAELIDQRDLKVGFTLLVHAVVKKQHEIARFLLREGANTDIESHLGETALHKAVDMNDLKVARLLLQHNADPNRQTSLGETPLHLAVFEGSREFAKLLLENGADPNVQNSHLLRTPLHYAMEYNYKDLCKLLIANCADLHAKDAEDNEPEDLASPLFLRSLNEQLCEVDDPLNCGKANRTSLCVFLSQCYLEQYTETLIRAGLDDLDALVTQMTTPVPISIDLLVNIGMKTGHAKQLLCKLEQPLVVSPVKPVCCYNPCLSESSLGSIDSLYDWLGGIQLAHLYTKFVYAGYDRIEMIHEVMDSQYAITDYELEKDIGVTSQTNRLRILETLLDERRSKEANPRRKSCSQCIVF